MAFGALFAVAWNGDADDLFVQPSELQFQSSRNLLQSILGFGFFITLGMFAIWFKKKNKLPTKTFVLYFLAAKLNA